MQSYLESRKTDKTENYQKENKMWEVIITRITGMLAVLLIFGGIPAAIVLGYYFNRKASHAERMALIEKGVDPSVFMKDEPPSYSALMWGLLILGIGVGAFLGYILSVYTSMGREYMMPTLALVFGGFGLVGFHLYRKKSEVDSAS